MPWGGDIPPSAKRFFSPYALWTRLKGDKGLNIVQNEVYHAFCAYCDLYLDLLLDVQRDIEDKEILESKTHQQLKEEDGTIRNNNDVNKGDVHLLIDYGMNNNANFFVTL